MSLRQQFEQHLRVEGNLVIPLPARISGIDDLADLVALQSVILAAPPADERHWADLQSLGGDDLLMRPCEPEETVRALAVAVCRAQ